MGLAFEIAGGLFLFAICARLMAGTIDWLDAKSSAITEDEARRRARLALVNQWPPPARAWRLAPRTFMAALLGLALLFLASRYLTR